MNRRQAAAATRIGPTTAYKLITKLSQGQEEWKKNYLDLTNRISEHYHPDLIQTLKKEVAQMQSAPEGWITKNQLAPELKVGPNTIENIITTYRQNPTYSDYFKLYKTGSSQLYEHLSPVLVQIIKNKLKKVQ